MWVVVGRGLTDIEALKVLVRRKGDGHVVGGRVRARTIEGEVESGDLAGLGLHWGRRGVTHGGKEAEDNGNGKAFHGRNCENELGSRAGQ